MRKMTLMFAWLLLAGCGGSLAVLSDNQPAGDSNGMPADNASDPGAQPSDHDDAAPGVGLEQGDPAAPEDPTPSPGTDDPDANQQQPAVCDPQNPELMLGNDTLIVAGDGQFLGVMNNAPSDPVSIANEFGIYGSPFGSISIWNDVGTYGGEFGLLSPFNDFTSSPPLVLVNGKFCAFLTTSSFVNPTVDPLLVASLVGRADEL